MIMIIAVLGVGCVLSAWHIWPFSTAREHTEDAYVRGNTTVISPQVSGYVTRVLVHDFDFVRAGQLIATIDDRIYRSQVREAQAALDAAVANSARSRAYRGPNSNRACSVRSGYNSGPACTFWFRTMVDV